MTAHHTFCALRFGDNIAHLQLLRALAKQHPDHSFIHLCRAEYLDWLTPVIEDLGNIVLLPLPSGVPWEYQEPNALNVWKGWQNHWQNHAKKADYVAYYLDWYAICADRMGLVSPIKTKDDFLFDYPALRKETFMPLDFLIVNHKPMSGQFAGYDAIGFGHLFDLLKSKGFSVLTTADTDLSATSIGAASINAKYIIMVSSGPSWPTFNVWNRNSVELRIVLLDSERVDISPNTVHCVNLQAAFITLKRAGLV